MSKDQVDVSLCPQALDPGEASRREVSELTIDPGVMRTRTTEPRPAGPSAPGTVKGADQTPGEASFLTPGTRRKTETQTVGQEETQRVFHSGAQRGCAPERLAV